MYKKIVIGKNDADYDVKAVQDAVDNGGSVLLKGVFNFGQHGRVNIKNDISISGDKNKQGRPLTKIIGGFWTFHSPLPTTDVPIQKPGPEIIIRNIHFDGAVWTPLHFSYTRRTEISGNKITNVQPYEIPLPMPLDWPGGEKLLTCAGILLGTFFAYRTNIIPGAVTGQLIVDNNSIDLKCKDPEMTLGMGVFILWTWGARIEIKRNQVRNVSRNSIETLDNYIDEEGAGSVFIAENNIITPSAGIAYPTPWIPNGIVVGWFWDVPAASEPSKRSKITVMRNDIQANGERAGGIFSITDCTAILENRVEIGGGSEAYGIGQSGPNAFTAKNIIEGVGANAIGVWPWMVPNNPNSNTFLWNDISKFRASKADVVFFGNKNMFIGNSCKVVDNGKDNEIIMTD